MATVTYGNDDTFAINTYNINPDASLREYAQRTREAAREGLTELGRQFTERVDRSYQTFLDSGVMRHARAARRRVASLWGSDEIQHLSEVWQVQNAPLKMREYVMAEPTYRQMYINQQCSGYEGEWVDRDPGKVGEDHRVYREVMDGIVEFDEDGNWTAASYSDSFSDHHDDLELEDQEMILATWETTRAAIRAGVDPGCKYNTNL